MPGGRFGATWSWYRVWWSSRDSHTSMTRYPLLAAPLMWPTNPGACASASVRHAGRARPVDESGVGTWSLSDHDDCHPCFPPHFAHPVQLVPVSERSGSVDVEVKDQLGHRERVGPGGAMDLTDVVAHQRSKDSGEVASIVNAVSRSSAST
jgi:hypothetical protein